MRDADFTGIRNGATAEQPDVANSMVWRTERTCRHERLFRRKQSRYAVNLRRFNCFLQRHRWNDGSDAFRQHRFARARRPDHENVVSAGNGHFQRPLHVRLTFYIPEIDLVALMGREKFLEVAAGRLKSAFATKK